MNRAAGVVVLVVGILLLGWGLNASNALESGILKVFTGSPSNKAIAMMVGGALMTAVGVSMVWYRRRRQT